MIAQTWCPECGPGMPIDEYSQCPLLRLHQHAESMCAAIVAAVLAGWDPESRERVRLAALAYRDAFPKEDTP